MVAISVMGAKVTPESLKTKGYRCGSFLAYSPSKRVMGCGYAEGYLSKSGLRQAAIDDALETCGYTDCKLLKQTGLCIPITASPPTIDWQIAVSKTDNNIFVVMKAKPNVVLKACAMLVDPVAVKESASKFVGKIDPLWNKLCEVLDCII